MDCCYRIQYLDFVCILLLSRLLRIGRCEENVFSKYRQPDSWRGGCWCIKDKIERAVQFVLLFLLIILLNGS
jgi:hypothetical protein